MDIVGTLMAMGAPGQVIAWVCAAIVVATALLRVIPPPPADAPRYLQLAYKVLHFTASLKLPPNVTAVLLGILGAAALALAAYTT